MKHKKIVTGIVSAVTLLASVGCGSNSKGGSTASNTLTYGCSALSGNFSPMYLSSTYDSYVSSLVFDSLITTDKKGNLKANMAVEVPKYENNGKRLTFKLKDGLKFSDGSTLDAHDVQLSIEVLADRTYTGSLGYLPQKLVGYKEYNSGKAEHIKGIKLLDDKTIQLNFNETDADNLLDFGGLSIYSNEQFKNYKNGKAKLFEKETGKPIGSGPYKLVKFNKSSGAALTKNENYSLGGYDIKNIVIKPVTETTQVDELKKGNIDILERSIVPADIAEASKDSNVGIDKYPRQGGGYITFNTADGATKDKAVRQALMYAFDRKSFVESYFDCKKCVDGVGKDLGNVPTTLQNSGSPLGKIVTGKEKLPGLKTYDYDIEKAKKVLDEAGWKVGPSGYREKNGEKLVVKMLGIEDHDICKTLIPMWKKDWGDKLKIDFKVTTVDFNTLLSKVKSDKGLKDWSVIFLGNNYSGVAMTQNYPRFHSSQAVEGGANRSRLKDKELDKLLEEGKKELNPKKQIPIFKKAMIITNEDCAEMPVYGNTYYQLYRKDRLSDFDVNEKWGWIAALKTAKLK